MRKSERLTHGIRYGKAFYMMHLEPQKSNYEVMDTPMLKSIIAIRNRSLGDWSFLEPLPVKNIVVSVTTEKCQYTHGGHGLVSQNIVQDTQHMLGLGTDCDYLIHYTSPAFLSLKLHTTKPVLK